MALPSVVTDVLRVAAPTLLTALGLPPPFSLLAASAVSGALGQWFGDPEPAPSPAAALAAVPQATPEAIIAAVEKNSGNQALLLDLRRAELDLQKQERELGFRYAELAEKSRERAGTYSRDTGLARPQFFAGMGLVCLSLFMLFGVILACIAAMTGAIPIDPGAAQITVAAFGLIGTVVGIFQGLSAQVVAFYFGASKSDSDKAGDLSEGMRNMAQAVASRPAPVHPAPAPQPVVVMPPPAPAPLAAPVAPEAVAWRQGPFGGVRWRLTGEGYVLLEGEGAPARTVGEPVTARRIWSDYGGMIRDVCAKHGVPVEVVVGVIATESRGQPAAVRQEPDGRASGGLMQVLTTTAAEVLGRPVGLDDLADPRTNIEAGVAYIASQRGKTGLDPILVAAAYNAGGLYPPREQDTNPFRLRCTGDHLSRMQKYFNDTVFVAKADRWFA